MICTTCCSVSRVSPLTREPDSSSGLWLALFVIITIIATIIIIITIINNNNHNIIAILTLKGIIATIITFSPAKTFRTRKNFLGRNATLLPRWILGLPRPAPSREKKLPCASLDISWTRQKP